MLTVFVQLSTLKLISAMVLIHFSRMEYFIMQVSRSLFIFCCVIMLRSGLFVFFETYLYMANNAYLAYQAHSVATDVCKYLLFGKYRKIKFYHLVK